MTTQITIQKTEDGIEVWDDKITSKEWNGTLIGVYKVLAQAVEVAERYGTFISIEA